MKPINERFLDALADALKKRGSAAQMARDTGIPKQHLSVMKSGKKQPGHLNTLKILECLTVHQRAAIFRREQEPPQ